MPNEDQVEHKKDQKLRQRKNENAEAGQTEDNQQDSSSSSESEDSDSDYDSDESSEPEEQDGKSTETSRYTRAGEFEDVPSDDDSPEANVERFARVLRSRRMRRMIEERERRLIYHEDLFDFPKDRENWREEDLKELWADAPLELNKPGWDPAWADEEDCEVVRDLIREGRDPPIAPFYLPFRKPYPVIPTDHYDIQNPKAVIEELDRIEEFLRWVSYIFPDGSSYEGTVWDDLAHGKGVYIAEDGLVRYEGEWLQNNMEGHGVVEVDVPDIEPVPGSKLEAQMRAEGKIIKRDFMTLEDREWLEMDIEDSIRLAGGEYEIPFHENDEWIKYFGSKPEKGRYRYAGQWKHSRMHGCGVYEVNERPIFVIVMDYDINHKKLHMDMKSSQVLAEKWDMDRGGRFYFGQLLDDPHGCDENTCALHAGIAEVAAAKARMFVNKPDGMVREERGPYSDPQHPYFYEEEDAWQAPGFINQFYEVPDYWKTYVHEVDQEREIWLNSFYKAPLRLPMPAELEYWWSKDDRPEFILINRDPKPDPEDPSKPIYTEDPLILHTPTGRLINYVEDEEHGIRLFWQPSLDEGEDVDPKKVEFLPLGFDKFYGRETVEKEQNFLNRLVTKVENALLPLFDKLEKWTEEKKKVAELKLKLIEKEAELAEAELCLEEAIEDMEEELKIEEKEAEKQADEGWPEVEDVSSPAPLPTDYYEKAPTVEVDNAKPEEYGAEEEEDEDNDNDAPSSFGSVGVDNDTSKSAKDGTESGSSAFSTISFASSSMISAVPTILRRSFLSRKVRRIPVKEHNSCHVSESDLKSFDSVTFVRSPMQNRGVRAAQQTNRKFQAMLQSKRKRFSLCVASQNSFCLPPERIKHDRSFSLGWLHTAPETDSDNILSLHALVQYPHSCRNMVMF